MFSTQISQATSKDYKDLFYFTLSELENPHKDVRGNYDDFSKVHY